MEGWTKGHDAWCAWKRGGEGAVRPYAHLRGNSEDVHATLDKHPGVRHAVVQRTVHKACPSIAVSQVEILRVTTTGGRGSGQG